VATLSNGFLLNAEDTIEYPAYFASPLRSIYHESGLARHSYL